MLIIKCLIFGISTIGSWELLRKQIHCDVSFLPSLTIAVQVCFLFMAGLLNILKLISWVLIIAGFGGFIYSIITDKGISFLRHYCTWEYLFLVIILVPMAFFVRGKVLSQYDNFSHWALVLRQMCISDRLPNFQDELITFQAYPLGSASFLYFCSQAISVKESVWMMGQIYWITCLLMPMFSWGKEKPILSLIIGIAFANFVFIYNAQVTSLIVDTLLPISGVCIWLFIMRYKNDSVIGNIGFYGAIFVYLVQLSQIKNASVFFVIIAVILVLWKEKRRQWKLLLTACGSPFVAMFLWKQHCSYVFPGSAMSKHAMTIENYLNIFQGKSIDDIAELSKAFIKFTLTYKDSIWLLGIFISIGLLFVFLKKLENTVLVRFLVGCIAVYFLYQIGVLGMYIFSMPKEEAMNLASSVRYTKTILIAIVYLGVVGLIHILNGFIRWKIEQVMILCLCVFIPFLLLRISFGEWRFLYQYRDNPQERLWIQQAIEEYQLPDSPRYCVVTKKNDYGYSYYLMQYLFSQKNIEVLYEVDSPEKMQSISADYILIYDEDNPYVQEWIDAEYPEQKNHKVICRKGN